MWSALRPRAAAAVASARQRVQPIFSGGALTSFARSMANKGYVTMKRRFKGLYGGKHIQFGNTISFSHRKCVRTFATPRARRFRRARSLTPAASL